MNRVLVLFAHPLFEKSRIHKALVQSAQGEPNLTFHDLYEKYPDFNIDIAFEQDLLLNHDILILQHPFYWYSVPPLMKQWIDMVLEYGWAYGKGGDKLTGKKMLNVISAGGREEVYHHEGRNRYTIREFLAPIDQTARLCHMEYLPPFVIHGTHLVTPPQITDYGNQYRNLLKQLVNGTIPDPVPDGIKYLNQYVELKD